jgi:hypothetical protein
MARRIGVNFSMAGIWGSARPATMARVDCGAAPDCCRYVTTLCAGESARNKRSTRRLQAIQSEDPSVGREQEEEDLIGSAIRKAYRVQSRMPEKFAELLRRLAQKEEQTAADDR